MYRPFMSPPQPNLPSMNINLNVNWRSNPASNSNSNSNTSSFNDSLTNPDQYREIIGRRNESI